MRTLTLTHSHAKSRTTISWIRALTILMVVLIASAILSLLGLRPFLSEGRHQHFLYLADAFAHGTFAVDNLPGAYRDKVIFNNHTYIPLGPMPGLVLTPLVAVFGLSFNEYWAALAIGVVNLFLLNRLLRHLGIQSS